MRTILFLAALVAGSSSAAAQAPAALTAKDKAALLATREQAWRAWFTGDRKTLEAMLPAEFIGIGWDDGPWDDRNAAIGAASEFASGGGKLTSLEFPKTEVQLYGDAAIVYSLYKAEFTSGGKQVVQEGRATEVFVRRGGKWLHPGWHLDSVK